MRFIEFTEARSNPSQNPKTYINDVFINLLDQTTDVIGGVKNLFTSFTAVDKLGINPKSTFETPIGIYAYPVSWVAKTLGREKATSTLPYAGEQPYVNIFNAAGNILNIATAKQPELNDYYKKIAQIWASHSGKDIKQATADIKQIISDAATDANVKTPGGKFWFVTMTVSNNLTSGSEKPMITWTKLFRQLGIDGIVDCGTNGVGKGIIHDNEPTQAVFFSVKSIVNNQRYNNTTSPGEISTRQRMGAQTHQTATSVRSASRSTKSPEELLAVIKKQGPAAISYLNEPMQTAVLNLQPDLIGFIKSPTDNQLRTMFAKTPGIIHRMMVDGRNKAKAFLQSHPNEITDQLVDEIYKAAPFGMVAPDIAEVLSKANPDAVKQAAAKYTKTLVRPPGL